MIEVLSTLGRRCILSSRFAPPSLASGRSRSVSLVGSKREALNINSKEKLPMEVWTLEIGLGIFASSLTSEKERGQGRKERKGVEAHGRQRGWRPSRCRSKLWRPVGPASEVFEIAFKVVAHNTERVVILRLCCCSQTRLCSYTSFHGQFCPTVNSGFRSLTWTRRDGRGPDLKFG